MYVEEKEVHNIVKDHIGSYHDRHHGHGGHADRKKEEQMDGARHVHIDNREDSPVMIPGMYGHGCGDGFGGMFGGLLIGALLGRGGFGGFGGFGGCGDGFGGGAASKADLAIDLRDSIVSDIQRQNIDRDVLESKFDLAIGQCNTNSKIDMCCCSTEKEILKTSFAQLLEDKKIEEDIFKTKCDLSAQIGALTCFTKEGFKDLCREIKQEVAAVNNNSAKQTIAGIISTLTAAPTDAQLTALNVALGSISTKLNGCCC